MSNPRISIVSPEYKGEKMVHELVERIKKSVSTLTEDFEIILVNDASPDNTWECILKEGEQDNRIKGINLSRNFGQHQAITAGLSFVKGEWVIVMDCDLQDRPEEIPNLYHKALEGYDIVYAQRIIRQDKGIKKLSSSIFHKTFNWLSGQKTDKSIANFGVYKRDVIDEFNKMPERARSFGSLINFLGFKVTAMPVQHAERGEGSSSYTLHKLFKLAFDIIISNSNKPLRMMVQFGFFFSLISMLLALYNVIAHFAGVIQVPGFTTTVFSIWFVGGLLMMQLGIVGIYIGKIFDQVKGRPNFVVMDRINVK